MTAEVLGVREIHPRTDNCAPPDDADTNRDGIVTDKDQPVCDPEPDVVGVVHVRGFRKDQGGEGVEMEAAVRRGAPVVRETNDGYEEVPLSAVQNGDRVSVWLSTGPGESWPLSGDADYVLITDS